MLPNDPGPGLVSCPASARCKCQVHDDTVHRMCVYPFLGVQREKNRNRICHPPVSLDIAGDVNRGPHQKGECQHEWNSGVTPSHIFWLQWGGYDPPFLSLPLCNANYLYGCCRHRSLHATTGVEGRAHPLYKRHASSHCRQPPFTETSLDVFSTSAFA